MKTGIPGTKGICGWLDAYKKRIRDAETEGQSFMDVVLSNMAKAARLLSESRKLIRAAKRSGHGRLSICLCTK